MAYEAAQCHGDRHCDHTIRAGRAINEVVQIATRRFRRAVPEATPEQVAQIENDIRSTLRAPKSAKPKQEKSLLPESLKEQAVPAESIEYEVRNREERKREAAEIIRSKGAEQAAGLLGDASIPGDTRVAIAGNLINREMLNLADAPKEKAAEIVGRLRSIITDMRKPLATELGQTIAMLGAIYRDTATLTMADYLATADRQRAEQIGGAPTEEALAEAAKDLKGAKTEADAKKVIERLKKKYTQKKTKEALTSIEKFTKRILELERPVRSRTTRPCATWWPTT